MSLPELLGRARGLSGREWLDLLRAHAALMAAYVEVRREKRGLDRRDIHGREGPEPEPGDAGTAPDSPTHRARELALAVERVVEYGPFRVRCLVEALALRRLLEWEGLDGGVVRVGVRRRGGEFAAHAWVEFRGVDLRQGRRGLDGFTSLPELDVFPER